MTDYEAARERADGWTIDCNLRISPECEGMLRTPGGILFGPPFLTSQSGTPVAPKMHVCVPCWESLRDRSIVERAGELVEAVETCGCQNARAAAAALRAALAVVKKQPVYEKATVLRPDSDLHPALHPIPCDCRTCLPADRQEGP